MAVRDLCSELGNEKYLERFSDLVSNKESRIDNEDERLKVWPTNVDRSDFATTHVAGSPAALTERYQGVSKNRTNRKIPDRYLYFSEKLRGWMGEELQGNSKSAAYAEEDRLEALWQVVRSKLQTVVIDLEDGDESQVIFETLNARGTQLLPADLVKNFLFHRAERAGEPVERIYEDCWQRFDSDFWRKEIKHGRIYRPRIDIFLQHYLSLKTLDEVRVTHLFNAFKDFVASNENGEEDQTRAVISAGQHVQSLSVYGKEFRTFYEPEPGSRLAVFEERLAAVDTVTVYPFLLEALHTLGTKYAAEFERILVWLEAFLIRRMICSLTSKNYNKLFIDLLLYQSTHSSVASSEGTSWSGTSTLTSMAGSWGGSTLATSMCRLKWSGPAPPGCSETS